MRQVEKSNPRNDPLFDPEKDTREPEPVRENLPPLFRSITKAQLEKMLSDANIKLVDNNAFDEIMNDNNTTNTKPNAVVDFIIKAVLFIAPIVGITIENPDQFTTAGIWGGIALALYLGYKIVRKYVLRL